MEKEVKGESSVYTLKIYIGVDRSFILNTLFRYFYLIFYNNN